ncbi:hypothetical protein C1645_740435 [Glomus cerebriforme]|uniref:Uncharacterized protein n=1 Tax=Glomus cerebriforme TaxID=658196 RepID=A0A397SQ13_9GLOM|nr:hypothetical protein C1645_740435 [Glomus cerebriforme]
MDSGRDLETNRSQGINSDSHNKSSERRNKVSLPKLQDVPDHLFDQLKDELHDFTEKNFCLLNADCREYFAKTFGITKVFPLYLDHSEFVIWLLDENKCLFLWNEMENSMIYMGSNLEEGITNYLIHPDRMCYIIEDTFERVPVNEYEHQLEEEFKNHMEERHIEKILETKAEIAASKEKKIKKKEVE